MRERARATPHNKENQERGKGKKKHPEKRKEKGKKAASALDSAIYLGESWLTALFKECGTFLKARAR